MVNVQEFTSIKMISKDEWGHLNVSRNPFISWDFFASLEESGCVGVNTGWSPLYFCAYDNQELVAATYLFIKTDSFGEFIFDWAWAQAYQNYGLSYYPKMTSAVPFSPVSAPKLLGDEGAIETALLPRVFDFYQKYNFSSLHFLFTNQHEHQVLTKLGLVQRDSLQYRLRLEHEQKFDDYLERLKSSKRKTIKKERKKFKEFNIKITRKIGKGITDEDIAFFYQCYQSTIEKKFSNAYLNSSFFQKIIRNLGDQVFMLIAYEESEPIGSALYLMSEETLYGRYWGSLKEVPYLHFEMCIYQGIELAIEHKLTSFEAGAQGEHKRMRGFSPTLTKSHHHLKDARFMSAVEDFVRQEAQEIKRFYSL